MIMEKTIEELILQELKEIKSAVNGLDKRMGALENRMEAMDKRMEAIENRIDSIEKRMVSVENRIDFIEKQLISIGGRLTSVEECIKVVESRLRVVKEKIAEMAESLAEVRTATNSLLDWADNVYAIEYVKDKRFPRIGGVGMFHVKSNAVEEEHARYFVESNGKRTYY